LEQQKNTLLGDGMSYLPYVAGGYQGRHCSEKRHGFVCSRPVIREFAYNRYGPEIGGLDAYSRVFLPNYAEFYSRQYKFEDEQIYNKDVIEAVKRSNQDLRPVFDGGKFDSEMYSLVAHGRGENDEVVRYSADAPFHAKGVTHDTTLDTTAGSNVALAKYA
jgi:hypothetical protein